MTVTTTTPTTTPTATPSAASSSASANTATLQGLGSLADNFNTFLTLLTTQLQNQDPTAPMDSNQFTQQLVQMTGVEQQLNTNSLLQTLVSNTAGGLSSAVGVIGDTIRATSSTATLTGGQAQWTYNLPSNASDLKVQVLDSNNNVVASVAPTNLSAGDHAFSWNGQSLNGSQLPDGGTYTLVVSATDANNNAITATTFQQGTVTGVTQNNGTTQVMVNGTPVPWTSVVSVTQPASAKTGS